jgi:hypothetical protein
MVHLPLDEDNAAKVAKTDVAVKVHAINSMYKGGELRSDIRDVCLSLSLSQVVQLLRCWTSNWARVAFACDCARKRRKLRGEAAAGR